MRKFVLSACFGLGFAAAPALAGDVYVIENAAGKKPVVIQKDSFALGDVPAMGEGKPNQGFKYGTALELAGTGVQIARGHVDAGGTVATHEGPQQYLLYVISGTGTLGLVDKDGTTTVAEVKYKPDDLIVFQPNTMHNWTNAGDTAMEFLGVDLAPPRK